MCFLYQHADILGDKLGQVDLRACGWVIYLKSYSPIHIYGGALLPQSTIGYAHAGSLAQCSLLEHVAFMAQLGTHLVELALTRLVEPLTAPQAQGLTLLHRLRYLHHAKQEVTYMQMRILAYMVLTCMRQS